MEKTADLAQRRLRKAVRALRHLRNRRACVPAQATDNRRKALRRHRETVVQS